MTDDYRHNQDFDEYQMGYSYKKPDFEYSQNPESVKKDNHLALIVGGIAAALIVLVALVVAGPLNFLLPEKTLVSTEESILAKDWEAPEYREAEDSVQRKDPPNANAQKDDDTKDSLLSSLRAYVGQAIDSLTQGRDKSDMFVPGDININLEKEVMTTVTDYLEDKKAFIDQMGSAEPDEQQALVEEMIKKNEQAQEAASNLEITTGIGSLDEHLDKVRNQFQYSLELEHEGLTALQEGDVATFEKRMNESRDTLEDIPVSLGINFNEF